MRELKTWRAVAAPCFIPRGTYTSAARKTSMHERARTHVLTKDATDDGLDCLSRDLCQARWPAVPPSHCAPDHIVLELPPRPDVSAECAAVEGFFEGGLAQLERGQRARGRRGEIWVGVALVARLLEEGGVGVVEDGEVEPEYATACMCAQHQTSSAPCMPAVHGESREAGLCAHAPRKLSLALCCERAASALGDIAPL